jgi:hypothetical protein
MRSFPITQAHYRTGINACIAAVLFVSLAPQFVHINSWVVAAVLVLAVGPALALRFFSNILDNRQDDDTGDGDLAVQRLRHPATIPPRPTPVLWYRHGPVGYIIANSQARPAGFVDAVYESPSDLEIANQLLTHLLVHRPIHQKIPQTERIRSLLLEGFAGSENPWMMDVAIGSVNLRIRGSVVELHVLPIRKQAVREPQTHDRSIFTDFGPSRSMAH